MSLIETPPHICTTKTKNGTFFHKTCPSGTCDKCHPKSHCIAIAESQNAEVLVEQLTDRGRRFGFYKDFAGYVAENRYKNHRMCEIITADTDCKLYFDIEFKNTDVPEGENPEYLFERTKKAIIRNYEAYFGMPLSQYDLFITNASGVGEQGSWAGAEKYSFHVIVNNGYFFRTNKDAQKFVKFIQQNDKTIGSIIDPAPYQKNQSFRLPYQSKPGSTRAHIPQNGTFRDFFVKRYSHDRFVGYYTMPNEVEAGKSATGNNNSTGTTDSLEVGTVHQTVPELPTGAANNLTNLLHIFGNDGYEYSTWFAVMCVCKNEGLSLEKFLDWSRLSSKCDESAETLMWNSLVPREGYNIGTLCKLINKKYPNINLIPPAIGQNYQFDIEFKVDEVSVPTIDLKKHGYDVLEYEQEYCRSIFELAKRYDDIFIHAHLGTGKTTVICDFVSRTKYEKVLCITPRVAFARSIFDSLRKAEPRMEFYSDVPKDERKYCCHVVSQLESITTLRDDFDLVIFDESESNLAQFDSTTIANIEKTAAHFERIMKNAKTTIWGDAFMMDRTLMNAFRLRTNTRKVYVKNTFQPYDRVAIRVAKDKPADFADFVERYNKQNPQERNVIATASKKNCEVLFGKINKTDIDGKDDTLKINSDTSDAIVRSIGNVNELWGEYKNVIYTTSITVGISYDRKDLPFDNLMIHFSAWGAPCRDLFQSSLRARKITNNTLYYSHYSRVTPSCNRARVFDRDELRKIIVDRDAREKTHLSEWLIDLWVFNNQEKNMNAHHHERVLNRYLKMCGYNQPKPAVAPVPACDIEVTTSTAYDFLVLTILFAMTHIARYLVSQNNPAMGDEEDEKLGEYQMIKSISLDEFTEHDACIRRGDATTDVKKEHRKYVFDHELLNHHHLLNVETRSEMYDVYINNKEKINSSVKNARLEKRYRANRADPFKDGSFECGESIYTDNKIEKLERLEAISNILGISTTYETESQTEIPRENIEHLGAYIEANLATLKTEWGLDMKNFKKHKGDWTEKLTLGFLNQIFSKWGFTNVARGKQSRKRVDGKRVDTSTFLIVPDKQFAQFEENCLFKKPPVLEETKTAPVKSAGEELDEYEELTLKAARESAKEHAFERSKKLQAEAERYANVNAGLEKGVLPQARPFVLQPPPAPPMAPGQCMECGAVGQVMSFDNYLHVCSTDCFWNRTKKSITKFKHNQALLENLESECPLTSTLGIKEGGLLEDKPHRHRP